ncbi:MAG: DUF6446 family protein [Gemmobacter sp.]
MTGKIVVLLLAAAAVIAGVAMYWLQVHAFYDRLPADTPLHVATDAGPRALSLAGFEGIDATSSPLRFRACARLAEPAELDDALPATRPDPLVAPGWFDCFDAAAIGAALIRGEARGYLSRHEIARGVDRVIAVYPDGRAYAWHQLNGTLEE